MEIPECFYRISIKALILNETRDKFIICQEENGMWDLPGGGLDWGSHPHDDLAREIMEEMGLVIKKVAKHPSYFVAEKNIHKGFWKANVVYETELEHLNFTPSDECVNIMFVNEDTLVGVNTFPDVWQIAKQFRPENHRS